MTFLSPNKRTFRTQRMYDFSFRGTVLHGKHDGGLKTQNHTIFDHDNDLKV